MTRAFWLTDQPLSIDETVRHVTRPEAGAVNTFIGTVREFTEGKRTLQLEYQAYIPMAEKKLQQIGEEIQARYGNAEVAICHRLGRLQISDIAVVIAVSTPHRNDAFEASRYAIERIKEIVPIWKKEYWEGGEEWIGDQLETQPYPSGGPGKEDMV
ncbi:molybdenum cofactor biosynthesis protein MoaE [Thalassobacillus sp. CUG 92003]|uniref:molybdenum cofactor biosynthesis protein MoaE n=1 Tax=Thalassobacillus sp. CUG 92003 TaxID=2736641 RepID=UPI0015E67FFF|nr:molybdenum cofactor biosynthesis protein MoaE [Thalassobacillus sp. CUG 92003]